MNQDEQRIKVQEHILDVFKEIIRVCELLNISYFVMGGTALGAVRHGGFIPWDDDLDIGMLREDYERFRQEAPEHLREDLFLQTYATEEKSPFYFSKVRKDNTEFCEYYCRKLDIHSGIYVDIFPYDNVPNNDKERAKYYRRMKYLLNLYIAKSVTEPSRQYGGMKEILYRGIRLALHILQLPIPKKVVFGMVDKQMRRYNSVETLCAGYGGMPQIQVRKADVQSPDEIMFEDIKVKCPRDIERYLRDNFGDYNILPPENERNGHAPYRVRV